MSSIGHVLDMVRRDKENRALRKNFRKRNSAKGQSVFKSNRETREISLDELEDIRKKVESKHKNDEYAMGKNLILLLLGGVVIVVITFYLLSVLGWF